MKALPTAATNATRALTITPEWADEIHELLTRHEYAVSRESLVGTVGYVDTHMRNTVPDGHDAAREMGWLVWHMAVRDGLVEANA